jgi:hypothetical protein
MTELQAQLLRCVRVPLRCNMHRRHHTPLHVHQQFLHPLPSRTPCSPLASHCHSSPPAAALVGLIGYGVSQQQPGSDMGGADSSQAGEAPAAPAPPPRENAVLVFGATGRMGRLVVQEVSLQRNNHLI